jgi:hypothetical protein
MSIMRAYGKEKQVMKKMSSFLKASSSLNDQPQNNKRLILLSEKANEGYKYI